MTNEVWTMREAHEWEIKNRIPLEFCMTLDSESKQKFRPSHYGFATIIVRMNGEKENDKHCMERANIILAAPDLLEAVKELKAALSNLQFQIRDRVRLSNDTINNCSYANMIAEKAIKKAEPK